MKEQDLALLISIDENGADFTTLGVLVHIILSTDRGFEVTAEDVVVDADAELALDGLIDDGLVREDDGVLTAVPFDDEEDVA